MSADVIPIVRHVDQAWEALRQHREPLTDNPGLLLDRHFVQTDIRLHDRFSRLYLMWSGAS